MSTNIIYTSIPQYLQSCKTLEARIAALDSILTQMELALATAASTGQFQEYKLDTGQTRTEVTYRNITELEKAYESLFEFQNKMINRLNFQKQGRQYRLVDGKNFPGRGYYGRFF